MPAGAPTSPSAIGPCGRSSAPAPGQAAGLIVLHGCGGFGTLDHELAADLPAAGFATLYLDYFGLTPAPSRHGFCGAHGAVGQAFPVWQRVTLAAAAAVRERGDVDPQRVGVVGWSLGGGLALATAEYGSRPIGTTPPRSRPFAALVAYSAGAFGPILEHADALPPTLVLSGGSGDAVPVADAVRLHDALVAAHVPSELYVYPHGNDQWRGRQGKAGFQRTVGFLRRHLG